MIYHRVELATPSNPLTMDDYKLPLRKLAKYLHDCGAAALDQVRELGSIQVKETTVYQFPNGAAIAMTTTIPYQRNGQVTSIHLALGSWDKRILVDVKDDLVALVRKLEEKEEGITSSAVSE
ncbi:hypothetical protein HY488_02075 [Candidatus Woesearchaeota archaeon]|nr:hypothetical protein [Candidatus Woesearchaeota archaeon]